jgi:hypothetical protein
MEQHKNSINLHIEELVLHGFEPGDRRRIGMAVESELTRLLTEQGVPPGFAGGISLPAVEAGAFQVTPHMKPAAIGQQVAQSVYAGLNK